MSIISSEYAIEKLSTFFEALADIPYDAFDSWKANPMATKVVTRSVESMGIWNEMVRFAEERFEGHPRAKWVKLKAQFGLLIDQRFFIRFKKGNTRRKSSNYPTLTALQFHDQEVDIFGATTHRMEVLYVLDKAGVKIESVLLVQRHKGRIVVDIELNRNAPPATNVSPFTPVQPSLDGTDSAAHIIKQPGAGNKDDADFKDAGGGA